MSKAILILLTLILVVLVFRAMRPPSRLEVSWTGKYVTPEKTSAEGKQ